MRRKIGMTFVELFIALFILGMLWSMAMLSISSWFTKTRDAKRRADLNVIVWWLEAYNYTYNEYPYPDNYVEIVAWGTNIFLHQWYAWDSLMSSINLRNKLEDPADEEFYTYSVNDARTKYQLMAPLENEQVRISYMNDKAYAAVIDHTWRYPYLQWYRIWILLNAITNRPQQYYWLNIDVVNTTENYKAYFDNWVNIIGSGKQLITAFSVGSPEVAQYDTSLVWYWKFDEGYWSSVYDDSLNSNTWTLVNWPKWVEGKEWKWLEFDWVNDYVNLPFYPTQWPYSVIAWAKWMNKSSSRQFVLDNSNGSARTLALKYEWGSTKWSVAYSSDPVGIVWWETVMKWTWYQIAASYNWEWTPDNLVNFYINWALQISLDVSPDSSGWSGTYKVWKNWNSSDNYFGGMVDEIRIYSRELSADEMAIQYNALK